MRLSFFGLAALKASNLEFGSLKVETARGARAPKSTGLPRQTSAVATGHLRPANNACP